MLNKVKNWFNNLITKSFMKVFIMLICFLLIGTESSYCNGFEEVMRNIFDENNFSAFIIASFFTFLIWFIILKIRRKERTLIATTLEIVTILTAGIFGLIVFLNNNGMSSFQKDFQKSILEMGFVVFIIAVFLVSLIWLIILKIHKKKNKGMTTTLTIATVEIIGLIIFFHNMMPDGTFLGGIELIGKILAFQRSLVAIIIILFLISLIWLIILKIRKKENKAISTIFTTTIIGILAILVLSRFDNEIKQIVDWLMNTAEK